MHKEKWLKAIKAPLDFSETALTDFGHLTTGRALGIAQPINTQQLQELVQFANQEKVTIAVRANGLSQSGQSIPKDGLSLNMSAFKHIENPDKSRMAIWCETGVSWRQLLEHLKPFGLQPKVMPLNLDLSIGGTLSAGGFGTTSHALGPAASHVLSFQAISGAGELIQCDASRDRFTFDAVLGGVGRCAIMTKVEIALRTVPSKIRTFYLLYDNIEHFIEDQRRIVESGHAHHLEGFCSAAIQGVRKGPSSSKQPFAHWFYGLNVSVEYEDEKSAPAGEKILQGLRYYKWTHTEDDNTDDFPARYQGRHEMMRLTGASNLAHPWLECILPLSKITEVIPRILNMLPIFIGDGHRLTWSASTMMRPKSLAVPNEHPYIGFMILPFGIQDIFCKRALDVLAAVNDILLSLGGKRYLSGWLFNMDEQAWRAHYGADYEFICEAKKKLDPNNILQSMLSY